MIKVSSQVRKLQRFDTGATHWDRASDSPVGARTYRCLWVRLKRKAGAKALAALDAGAPQVLMADHERARLDRLATQQSLAGADVILHVLSDGLEDTLKNLSKHMKIQQFLVGSAGIERSADPERRVSVRAGFSEEQASRTVFRRLPVLGIVDDEIGFLNWRFCDLDDAGHLKSRVQGVWVQQCARTSDDEVLASPVLGAAQINALLCDVSAGRIDEMSAYKSMRSHAGTAQIYSRGHGTHVLDLAAGFAPGSAPELPIFAVDMPPHALHEPSRQRGTLYLVQAIRWLIQSALDYVETRTLQSLMADDGTGKIVVYVPDIALTCSIGGFAGPKDGSGIYAQIIGRELDLVNAMHSDPVLSGGHAYRATLFQSFGNAFQSRQIAHHDNTTRTPPLEWVLPRNDTAPSLLEVRISAGRLKRIWMRIAGQDIELKGMKQHRYRDVTDAQGRLILRLYRDTNEAHGRQLYRIFVQPTVDLDTPDAALMPSGPVRMVVDTTPGADVLWQVERDDTPYGYSGEGRQSMLRDVHAQDYAPSSRSYSGLGAGSAVMHEGTETPEAHSPHPAIVTVGALQGDRPSGYSASGATEVEVSRRQGPDISATGDDGTGLGGVLASGTFSGSVIRLAGTSVAAPQAARRMALSGVMPPVSGSNGLRAGPRYEDPSGARDPRQAG